MTLVAPTLQAFFTDRLTRQLQASPRTIASYRDTLRLLLCFTQQHTGKQPATLDWDDLNEPIISAFLEHLETDRHNTARTRNLRLTAIRSLFKYAALAASRARERDRAGARDPAQAPPETTDHLPHRPARAEALINAPDQSRWEGRRDRAMLTLTIQAGLRVSELIALELRRHPARDRRARPLRRQRPKTTRRPAHHRPPRPCSPPGSPSEPDDQTTRCSSTRTGRRLSRDAIEQRVTTHAATAAIDCPSLKASNCTRTCSATAARCRSCKPASTPPSSPSGSDTPTSAPPSPTSTPTSRSRRKRSRSSPRPTSNPAATSPPDALLAFLESL